MYTLEEHIQTRNRLNRAAVKRHIHARGFNTGAYDAMNASLDRLAEQQRWLDAGLLAVFRNWRNR